MPSGDFQHSRSARPGRWLIVLGAAFVVLAAASMGYLLFISAPATRAEALEDWESRLVSMANDREVAIERWVADLTSVARTLALYPTAEYALSDRAGPPYPFDPEQGPEPHLGELFDRVLEVHGYTHVMLFDTAGRRVAQSSRGAPIDGWDPDSIAASAAAEVPSLDLYPGATPVVAAAEPVHDAGGSVVGAAVILTEAEPFLLSLLRQQPVPSSTGETVLMARRDGEPAYISPLRKTDAPPGQVSVVIDSIPRTDRAGGAETMRYIDYARTEVLAATRPIEGAPWTLVAKVDVAEALEDYHTALAAIVAAILGLLVGALGLVFGIWRWQHQQLASAVLEEQARFTALLDHANDPIVFLDAEGRILDVNRRALEFYGVARNQLVGRPGRILRSEADRSRAADHLAVALEKGTALVHAEHVLATGEGVPVEISTRRVELADGTTLISIVRDLRERRAVEEALRETEERYRTLVKNLPDLIARFDDELRCQFVSLPVDGISPFPVDDPVGRSVSELGLPDRVASQVGAAIRDVLATGTTREIEVTPPLTGSDRSFDWRIVPEHGPEDRITSAVVIVRETTEQRALEQQLRQAQKMDAVGRLAGGVAHDFNNIITSIQGHATLVLDQLGADSPEADDLGEIIRSAERAASLTRQLLAFSRRQIVEPRRVDLGDTVLGMEGMLRRLIGENIALDVRVAPDGEHTTLADPSQIEQVVLNLVINARDAMPNGGRLRVTVATADWPGEPPATTDATTDATGGAVRLSVEDSGVGMDPDTVDRIFEPFFTTKTAEEGTGLGLSTVYGIVEQAHGTIDVETEPGRGTRIDIHFPATPGEAREPEAGAPEMEPAQAPSPAPILLVEDETGVRRLAERVLKKEGYRVVVARSGGEALKVLDDLDDPPQLLITDMVMPGMDGRQLAEAIRRLSPACRVVLMSGYTEDVVIREQLLEPGMAFLPKPFTPDQLTRRVAETLASDPDAGDDPPRRGPHGDR